LVYDILWYIYRTLLYQNGKEWDADPLVSHFQVLGTL
jgi:hypothetical protein